MTAYALPISKLSSHSSTTCRRSACPLMPRELVYHCMCQSIHGDCRSALVLQKQLLTLLKLGASRCPLVASCCSFHRLSSAPFPACWCFCRCYSAFCLGTSLTIFSRQSLPCILCSGCCSCVFKQADLHQAQCTRLTECFVDGILTQSILDISSLGPITCRPQESKWGSVKCTCPRQLGLCCASWP